MDVRCADLPQLASVQEVTAYRIIQEALTNARRHGRGGTTTLELAWADASLHIAVRNRANPSDYEDSRPGHGLTGIGERARLFGGHADARRHGEEWRVSVELPTPRPVAGSSA